MFLISISSFYFNIHFYSYSIIDYHAYIDPLIFNRDKDDFSSLFSRSLRILHNSCFIIVCKSATFNRTTKLMIHDLYSIPNHHSFPSSNPLYQSIFPSPSTQRKTKYLSKKLNQYSNYQHKKRKTLLILFMMGFLICIFILYKGNSIQLKKINNKHTPLSSGSFLRTNENNPPRRLIDTSTPFPIHHSMFSFFIFNRTEDLNRIHKMTESILTYHHTHPDPPHYLYSFNLNSYMIDMDISSTKTFPYYSSL